MRFLVDECTGPKTAEWLRSLGHDVFSVFDDARGASDDEIIKKAFIEDWILITNDKDFGEKVYRQKLSHRGIVFLRLADERSANKISVLSRLIELYADQLADHFVVVTETRVRFANTSLS